jgi:hypothetical protein
MTPVSTRDIKTGDRARRALAAVLPRTATTDADGGDSGVDLIVNGVRMQVKWVGEGELRQVRRLLAGDSGRLPDIVAARLLSPGAREALSKAGVGWVDETGAAEVSLPRLVISRSGQAPRALEREPRWNRSVLAVAEALLCGGAATVSATTRATGLSAASCTIALRTLTGLELLTASARRGRGSGRRVEDPDRLLDAYARAAAAAMPKVSLTVGLSSRDPVGALADVGQRWSQRGIAWAATGTIAAAILAPYLTSVSTADVYVDADTYPGLESVATAAGLQHLEGGRLTLRPFPTVTSRRLATTEEELRVVPWPRVFADLRAIGVRGEEAAEHLREVVRGP